MRKPLKRLFLPLFKRLVDLPPVRVELGNIEQRLHEVGALLNEVGFLGLRERQLFDLLAELLAVEQGQVQKLVVDFLKVQGFHLH